MLFTLHTSRQVVIKRMLDAGLLSCYWASLKQWEVMRYKATRLRQNYNWQELEYSLHVFCVPSLCGGCKSNHNHIQDQLTAVSLQEQMSLMSDHQLLLCAFSRFGRVTRCSSLKSGTWAGSQPSQHAGSVIYWHVASVFRWARGGAEENLHKMDQFSFSKGESGFQSIVSAALHVRGKWLHRGWRF